MFCFARVAEMSRGGQETLTHNVVGDEQGIKEKQMIF